jgi:hypothetical protein
MYFEFLSPLSKTEVRQPSVQSLFLELWFGLTRLAVATGFIAIGKNGPVLVTNYHNLSGRSSETGKPISPNGGIPDRVRIWHNSTGGLGKLVLRDEPLLDADGTGRWLEHPTLGSRVDVVALPLTQFGQVEIIPSSIGVGDTPIRVGPADPVSIIGFPFGIRTGGSLAIWATGFVASEIEVDHDDLPMFLVDCRARKGQSGSPVLSYRSGGAISLDGGDTAVFNSPVSRFLGVYSGRINEESDLGIVWKAKAVRAVVDGFRQGTKFGSTVSTGVPLLPIFVPGLGCPPPG